MTPGMQQVGEPALVVNGSQFAYPFTSKKKEPPAAMPKK